VIRFFFHSMILAIFALALPVRAEEDLRTMVRAGCLDQKNCCFGRWQVASDAIVYQSEGALDKAGFLKAGEDVLTVGGRVHVDPGRLKILVPHGRWKKDQVIGLYSEPDARGKALVGTVGDMAPEDVRFLGSNKCEKPSKECWAVAVSRPKAKWWIKVKLSSDETGFVDSSHLFVDTECNL